MNGFKVDDKVIVDKLRNECSRAILTSKDNYLKSLGNKLIDKLPVQRLIGTLSTVS